MLGYNRPLNSNVKKKLLGKSCACEYHHRISSHFHAVFWSVAWLPYPWNVISKFNPVYWMVNGLRYSMLNVLDENFSTQLALIVCLLFCLFFSVIASYLVSKGYRIKS